MPVVRVIPAGKISVGPPIGRNLPMTSRLNSSGSAPSALQRLLRAVEQLLQIESASAVLLVIATAAALAWANFGGSSYIAFWRTGLIQGPAPQLLTEPLLFWVNDGLMTFFFLLVGLEIRAEIDEGVLAHPRHAILPIAAALGGIIVPALIFVGLNCDAELRRGWAIPIATDIAFSAGALALLGKRVPRALRVFLLTVAIVDDIAAVLVIAIGYSGGIALDGLVIAGCGVFSAAGLHILGVRPLLLYAVAGPVIWVGLLQAGIHPTLAGVILGIMTPVSTHDEQRKSEPPGAQGTRSAHVQLKDVLHSWVAFAIMPLFALANAGVYVRDLGESVARFPSLAGGILSGLVIGKPIGIGLALFVCIKSGIGALPPGLRWRDVVVAGSLAGIGFTMSIFLADLAFPAGDRLVASKSAILVASALATVTGLILGRLILPETAAVTDVGNLPDEHNPDNKNPSRVAEDGATKTSETQKRQGSCE